MKLHFEKIGLILRLNKVMSITYAPTPLTLSIILLLPLLAATVMPFNI